VDTLSYLIAMAVLNQQSELVRAWPSAPESWIERVSSLDHRVGLQRSYVVSVHEARIFARGYKGAGDVSEMEGSDPRTDDTASSHVFRLLTVPYMRLSLAGLSEGIRSIREEVAHTNPCTIDKDERDAEVKARFPRWNIVGPVGVPSSAGWLAVRNAMLGYEMTRLVLEGRRLDSAAPAPAPRPSAICEGYAWHYEALDGRRLSIALVPSDMATPYDHPSTFVMTRRP
jgi:hypothetical protein